MHLPWAGKAHLDILFFLLADIFQDNDPHKIEIPRWPGWRVLAAIYVAGVAPVLCCRLYLTLLATSAEYSSDFLGPSICEK